jgi:hypothetical protein
MKEQKCEGSDFAKQKGIKQRVTGFEGRAGFLDFVLSQKNVFL